jgi:predicted alpha/beta superfamily hydrolase
MNVRRLLAPCLALAITVPQVAAQGGQVTIPGSERYLMKSATNGIEYRLDIALPSGYATSGKRYPVFYILDANLEFAHLADTYRQLRIDGGVPEMILVGIGYQEDDPAVYTPAYHANRSRDYTPTAVEAALPGSGQAKAFLGFIKTELIPLIDGRYRTDSTDRALGGHSLGGLFTTYTLLTEPTLFRHYWIGSPSLWWDKEVSFTWVDPATKRAEKPKGRAFLTVGSLESTLMVPPMQRMAARLKAGFPTLEVGSIVFPDETHMSVIGGALSRALRFLYARPIIPIAAADLAQYAGRWKAASGETLRLAAAGPRLMLTMTTYGASMTIELFAEKKDRLFAKVFNLDIGAEREGSGKVVRLRRTFMNAETSFERVK